MSPEEQKKEVAELGDPAAIRDTQDADLAAVPG
jgi:hypothetical protein